MRCGRSETRGDQGDVLDRAMMSKVTFRERWMDACDDDACVHDNDDVVMSPLFSHLVVVWSDQLFKAGEAA